MDNSKQLLFEDYSIEISTDENEFMSYFIANRDKIFHGNSTIIYYDPPDVITKEKIDKLKSYDEFIFKFRIYILKGNERVGWFLGEQINTDTFYMRNTGIFEEYRNKGIYKKLLTVILDIVQDRGFKKVTSSHIVTNNPVIVAKLKAGFMITGFEISEKFGLFLNLTYNFSEVRNKILRYRSGEITADEQLALLLNPISNTTKNK